MTARTGDLLEERTQGRAAPVPAAPAARRLQRPRWLNLRVLVGVLVVVGCVVLGARLVGDERRLTAVWAVSHDLDAGTVITADDLTPVEVNLADVADRYLGTGSAAVGRQLTQRLGAGELLPAGALADPSPDSRLVTVPVGADQVLPGLARGAVIDLYLQTQTSGGTAGRVEQAGSDWTVQDVIAPSTGGLSGAGADEYQLVLLLPTRDAQQLIARLPGTTVRILLHAAG